ncbi:MAG: hypothetical protein O7G85_08160 [Planctomycetota bacterium]|nr:hypothetical protein [Planctomycetota bacterium]
MLVSCAATNKVESEATNDARFNTLISNDRTYRVQWHSLPDPIPLNEPFALELVIFENGNDDQDPLRVELAIDGRMPEHRHGMNVFPEVVRGASGSYRVSNMLFHMPGYWQLHFDITVDGVTERAQADVDLE